MQPLGVVDAGVRAAAWSPDQEALVLVTRLNTAIAMSTDMDVLHEVHNDYHCSQSLSAGRM
jgi:elongator complex protein 1